MGNSFLQSIFIFLTKAVYGTPLIALSASFIWGVLSVLLSPCHLASIPLIIGFIDEQGRTSTKRAFIVSLLFSIGILITIAIIGVFTSLAGRMLGDIGSFANYFVAIIFFVVGFHLLGIYNLPFSPKGQNVLKRKGLLAAFLLGLVFGIALGPCTFAFMAPILGITFSLSKTKLYYGISLLILYGIGHCSVIVFAGTFTEIIQNYLNWNESSKGAVILKKICGAFVLAGGVYMIYIAR